MLSWNYKYNRRVQIWLQQAIWFQTEAEFDWEEDEEEQEEVFFDMDDVVEYILNDYVLSTAGNYTNRRIEKYLYGDFESDW